jgi:hypothetical protein
VLDTNVVARALPFQFTTESARKFVPFTVNVNPAPPADVEEGLKVVVVGTGLGELPSRFSRTKFV